MMEPGVWYPGKAMLNAFGELVFTPEQTGSRVGRIQEVTSGEGYKVSTTNKRIIFHISFQKQGTWRSRLNEFMKIVNKLIIVLKDYDF